MRKRLQCRKMNMMGDHQGVDGETMKLYFDNIPADKHEELIKPLIKEMIFKAKRN